MPNPRKQAAQIRLSDKERKILTKLNEGTHSELHLIERAGIILLADRGESNNGIERAMRLCGNTITKWRDRYSQAREELARVEKDEPRKLHATIEKILSDAPRSGKPANFTDEQVACILALACEQPEQLDLPFSNWTPSLLRDEVIKLKIVDSISAKHIGRFLKRARFKATQGERLAQPEN